MKFELINREVMVVLKQLTGELERFRGLRALWADQAGNREPSSASVETPEGSRLPA